MNTMKLLPTYWWASILRAPELLRAMRLGRKYLAANRTEWLVPIPPPQLHYNRSFPRGESLSEYIDNYVSDARDLRLPYLIKTASLSDRSWTLEFGCGLGQLAAAFLLKNGEVGRYIGWEPEPNALLWLRDSYKIHPQFLFGGLPLPKRLNYVTNNPFSKKSEFDGTEPTVREVAGLVADIKLDLITSFSVFTHMWPRDAVSTLKILTSVSCPETIMVHTWLILDDFSEQAVRLGKADRRLPIAINGIRTYSRRNPLVCTAYKMMDLKRIYSEAGQEILHIDFGSWSGRGNGVINQDIVVSRRTNG